MNRPPQTTSNTTSDCTGQPRMGTCCFSQLIHLNYVVFEGVCVLPLFQTGVAVGSGRRGAGPLRVCCGTAMLKGSVPHRLSGVQIADVGSTDSYCRTSPRQANAPTCLASLVEAEAYDTGGGSHQAGSENVPEAAVPAAAAVRPTAASCVSRSNSSSCKALHTNNEKGRPLASRSTVNASEGVSAVGADGVHGTARQCALPSSTLPRAASLNRLPAYTARTSFLA